MGIGKILASLIEEKKTNVNEVAKNANISPSTLYSMIKRDSMKVDIDVLIKISKSLGVSADYFYDMYQQENSILSKQNILSSSEYELIKKYRALDERGKNTIDKAIDEQYGYVKPKIEDTAM